MGSYTASRRPFTADEDAHDRLNRQEKYIGFRMVYAAITDSATAALVLSQMRFLTKDLTPDENGHRWACHTREEWWEETRLGRYELENARKILIRLGFIYEQRTKGGPTFFRLDHAKVDAAIRRYTDTGQCPVPGWKPADSPAGNQPTPPAGNQPTSPAGNQPTPRLETSRPPAGNQPTSRLETSRPPNRDLRVLEKSRVNLSPKRPSTGQEEERADPPSPQPKIPPARAGASLDETPVRQIPQPDTGPGDPVELAKQICRAYPKNSHLKPHELNSAHVAVVLETIRAEARDAESTQTDAALMLLELVEALAKGIRTADPDRFGFLPTVENYFHERKYRLPIEIFTRPERSRATKFSEVLARFN
jgi:hypothetical protein